MSVIAPTQIDGLTGKTLGPVNYLGVPGQEDRALDGGEFHRKAAGQRHRLRSLQGRR
jgi:hypothetical protein